VSETESARRSTASGHRSGAASNPALRLVCLQWQGAGSSDARAGAGVPSRRAPAPGYSVGTAVLDAVQPASAGPTAVVLEQGSTGNFKVYLFGKMTGIPIYVLREDRILHEAHATGGDVRRIC
jgi:hypothetical protein